MKPSRRLVAVLCVLCAFAGNSFGQIAATEKPSDFTAQAEMFSRLIKSGTIEQKRDALSQIRNLETAAASRLAVPALRDQSEIVRATAAGSVVFLPAVEAAPELIRLLADKKPFVRREAADALGKVGDASRFNSLLRVLQTDKISEVRNAAIIALGKLGNAAAVAELVKILQRGSQMKEEFARRSAARSIGQIAQTIQTGKIQVVTPENFLPEPFKRIESPTRPRLTEEFPTFQTAVGALIETLRNPKEFADVRREAAFALGAIGDAAAISVLQANRDDEDYYLAEICRESLRKIAAAVNRGTIDKI